MKSSPMNSMTWRMRCLPKTLPQHSHAARAYLPAHAPLYSAPTVGASYTPPFEHYDTVWVELSENCTITVSGLNKPHLVPACLSKKTLYLNRNTHTVTWSGVTTWIGGEPTLTADNTAILEFYTPDGGTTIIGSTVSVGITEITKPVFEARVAYGFGGNYGYQRSMTFLDMVNEAAAHQWGMCRLPTEYPLGAASDMESQGWISTGQPLARYLQNLKIATGALAYTAKFTNDFGQSHGSPNACFGTDDGANELIYFPPGRKNGSAVTGTVLRVNARTGANSTQISVTDEQQECGVLSDNTRGWILGSSDTVHQNNRARIDYTSGTYTAVNVISARRRPMAVGNDQTTNGYLFGGADSTNAFGLNTIRRQVFSTEAYSQITATAGTSGADASPFGSNLIACYGWDSGSATSFSGRKFKFTFSTETRANWPGLNLEVMPLSSNSQNIKNVGCLTDFSRN